MGFFVPEERLELSRINPTASETATFTNFAIRALVVRTVSAQDKIRTCTTFRSPPPQDGMSTNFTTWAMRGVKDTAFFFFAKQSPNLIRLALTGINWVEIQFVKARNEDDQSNNKTGDRKA